MQNTKEAIKHHIKIKVDDIKEEVFSIFEGSNSKEKEQQLDLLLGDLLADLGVQLRVRALLNQLQCLAQQTHLRQLTQPNGGRSLQAGHQPGGAPGRVTDG